ncbi:hypothetical protein TEQG_03176 [Trichophyton equinum CBS 127.97]|uniref:Uncharacterized protein n=1 Tax=Trichophyton equinum (strain ATCC MYA-4606 / CBS 127.97) TaxID=559882 RepID=F2PQH5_TRIEC|nr:hypothetical protein TEQG_03176 [Trichophyton equinum CBS 127.97]
MACHGISRGHQSILPSIPRARQRSGITQSQVVKYSGSCFRVRYPRCILLDRGVSSTRVVRKQALPTATYNLHLCPASPRLLLFIVKYYIKIGGCRCFVVEIAFFSTSCLARRGSWSKTNEANKTNKTNFPKLLIVAASALVQIEVSAEYCVIRIGETFRSRSTEKPKAVSSAAETRFLQAKKVIFLRKSRTAKVPKV